MRPSRPHTELHGTSRIGWLRAAVLGANDGIVSTASLLVGVAVSQSGNIVSIGVAALVAGAMSMAAGEYVSVHSQADAEEGDLSRERAELTVDPAAELGELTAIYVARGVEPVLAQQVAEQMMKHDALGAHARDELGMTQALRARPVQAALASAASFAVGAALPLAVTASVSTDHLIIWVSVISIASLTMLGALAAWAGGAAVARGASRVAFWGALAIATTAGSAPWSVAPEIGSTWSAETTAARAAAIASRCRKRRGMCHVRSQTSMVRDGTRLADRCHAMLDKDTWIVGLDLGERSRGALCFSYWLGDGSDRITGVHVIETWSRQYIADDSTAVVHRAVADAARELGISPPAHIAVVEADDTVGALTHAAEGAAGLVIGRATRSYDGSLVRLGHVARRLLRVLPGPVVVVPRDLTAVAPGPVLLATDLGVATSAALPFARALAAHHGVGLEVLHVGEARHNELIDELGPGWITARELHHAEVTRSLDAWMHEHGIDQLPRHVLFGDPSEQIAAAAVRSRAALVVVGSRRLGAGSRLFLSSTASALAGSARCPVAVVPPLVDAHTN